MKKVLHSLILAFLITLGTQANAQCRASFTHKVIGDTVEFTNTSTNSTSYQWTFGDGTTSTAKNPIKVYSSAYRNKAINVCLTAMDKSTSCSDKVCHTVVVRGATGGSGSGTTSCNANFSVSERAGTFYFKADTTVKTTYYTWNFGDGSTDFNVGSGTSSHQYKSVTKATMMRVCLYINNHTSGCADSFCRTITVYPDTCSASFVAKPNGGGEYYFANTSAGSATATYSWNFGDGNTSTDKSPLHDYASPGKYQVCLTVTDSANNCSSQYCDSVKVDSIGCKASFGEYVTGMNQLTFDNGSVLLNGKYTWTFGDGNTSTTKHPQHTYAKAGKYKVCLIAYNTQCADTMCTTVTIDSSKVSCRAYFNVQLDSTGGKKYQVKLVNGSSNASTHSYKWTFGDGGSSTQRNPSHQYKKFGKFEVCLTVADKANNCSSTFCDSVGMDSTGRLYKAEGFGLQVVEDQTSSVKKIVNVDYKLYPNPSTGMVNVELTSVYDGAYVRVYSIEGQLVAEQTIDLTGNAQLDLSKQENGIYVFAVFDGQNHTKTKLVKMSE